MPTYVGAGIADNWEALFRTMDLFREMALEVADDLGYAYPHELDRGDATSSATGMCWWRHLGYWRPRAGVFPTLGADS